MCSLRPIAEDVQGLEDATGNKGLGGRGISFCECLRRSIIVPDALLNQSRRVGFHTQEEDTANG